MKTRMDWAMMVAVALPIVYGCGAVTADASASKAPNIVLILTDDQGWSQTSLKMREDIPASGSTYLHTPNIERLAKGGMRFTSGYAPAPLCTPTRRSIQCGASAARSGSEFASAYVPAEHMTIPRALKKANGSYRCAHFGKWGEKMISTPEDCGYDMSDGETGNVTGGMEDKMEPHHIVEDPKRTGTVTARACDFMRTQVRDGKPFYLQVSYYAVHLRVELLQASLDKYQKKGAPDRSYTPGWAGMLGELDTGIGGLLDCIDELKIADSTYVFYLADNGGRGVVPGGDRNRLPPNHPLSGAKHSLLEGGIRVPFFIRGPGIKPGSKSDVPVVGYDFLPTFSDLAGGATRFEGVDGGSLKPLFLNPDAEVGRPYPALIFHRPGRLMSAIRQGNDKLFVQWNRQGTIASRKLCNVHVDPAEEKDLAGTSAMKASELEKLLLSYLDSVNAEKSNDNPSKKRDNKKRGKKK